jgi:tRNA U38,U39,U40 pseudouridine synthase TruA
MSEAHNPEEEYIKPATANLLIRGIPVSMKQEVYNISSHLGIKGQEFLRSQLKKIIAANQVIDIGETTELKIKNIPPHIKGKIDTIADFHGMTSSAFMKEQLRHIVAGYPAHMREKKKED